MEGEKTKDYLWKLEGVMLRVIWNIYLDLDGVILGSWGRFWWEKVEILGRRRGKAQVETESALGRGGNIRQGGEERSRQNIR